MKKIITCFILAILLSAYFVLNIKAEETHSVTGRTFSYLTDSEYDLLCRAVSAESGGETLECQIAVTETILNRIDSTRFPNTLYDVIYAPGQFEIVSNGSINRKIPSAKTIQAVNIALQERTIPDDVLYFNSIGFFNWVIPYEKIDHMYFSSVSNNKVKNQICINEITFYGKKDVIMKIYDLLSKEYPSKNKYGKTWYGYYLREIGTTSNKDTNGYINSISIPDILDGKYYVSIKTYTDNDINDGFIRKIAEYYQVDYFYMSTNPTSKENYIYDRGKTFYKYGYLIIIRTNNLEISKYLKTKENVIEYINDKFNTHFEKYEEAVKYVENLSTKSGASVVYQYTFL